MSTTKNKRKTATAIAATAAATAVLLTGTYAWQNLNQEALNASAGVVNPGGRLHDDFNGENKDVYVENFADENIYARIQLTEYMEIGNGAGLDFTSEDRKVTVLTSNNGETSTYTDKSTWQIHTMEENETDKYWTWTYGGSTVYMPTFNMNKDSLTAEINGTFEGNDKTDGDPTQYDEDTGKYTDQDDRYSNYHAYEVDEPKTADEIYDADTNDVDEEATGGEAIEGENIRIVEGQTHTAKNTENARVVSMYEWMNELTEEEKEAESFWVYDTDGWAYWSKPIKPDTATGLLLDGIELTGVVDDNWYYAINVTAQFITGNDIGSPEEGPTGSGFYDTSKGTEPSADALALLESIGVNITKTTEDNVARGELTLSPELATYYEGFNLAPNNYYSLNLTEFEGVSSDDLTITLQKGYITDNGEDVTDRYYDAETNTLFFPGTEEIWYDSTYTLTVKQNSTDIVKQYELHLEKGLETYISETNTQIWDRKVVQVGNTIMVRLDNATAQIKKVGDSEYSNSYVVTQEDFETGEFLEVSVDDYVYDSYTPSEYTMKLRVVEEGTVILSVDQEQYTEQQIEGQNSDVYDGGSVAKGSIFIIDDYPEFYYDSCKFYAIDSDGNSIEGITIINNKTGLVSIADSVTASEVYIKMTFESEMDGYPITEKRYVKVTITE